MKRTLIFVFIISTTLLFSQEREQGFTRNEVQQRERNFSKLLVEALKLKNQGKFTQASVLLQECLKIDPNSAVVNYNIALIYTVREDYNSALIYAQKAHVVQPTNEWYLLLLASLYVEQKKFDLAIEEYHQLHEIAPEKPEYFQALKELYVQIGEPQKAIKFLAQVEKEHGMSEPLFLAKYSVLVSMEKYKKAIQLVNNYIEFTAPTADLYGIQGELYEALGNKEVAMEYYQKVLELDPNNEIIFYTLTRFHLEKKDTLSAWEALKSFYENEYASDKMLAEAFFTIYGEDKWLNSQEQAYELLEIFKKSHPVSPVPYSIFAGLYLEQENYELARENLSKSLQIQPENIAFWQQLAFINLKLEDTVALRESLRDGIIFCSANVDYRLLYGSLMVSIEEYDEAYTVLVETLPMVKENKDQTSMVYGTIGDLFLFSHDTANAIVSYDSAVLLNPRNTGALNNYAFVLAEQGKDLKKAEKLIVAALDVEKNSAHFLDTYAWIFYKMGQCSLAKFYIEKALFIDDSIAELHEHHGDILVCLSSSGFMEAWDRAIELDESKREVLTKKKNEHHKKK